MSNIPQGTKFHGVDSSVDTVNKGSATANALRDAYTIEQLASAIDILIENDHSTRLVPFFLTAAAGGSSTYTEHNNIVDIDWTGGVGTYVLTLPSATAMPYRIIRFVNNSTITAADKVHITAPVGETIDGVSFYEINKPYNGCAVWSDGTEWVVIQAKST
jgi:hypothetical protein